MSNTSNKPFKKCLDNDTKDKRISATDDSNKQLMSQGGFVEEVADNSNNDMFPESAYLEYAESEEVNDKSE